MKIDIETLRKTKGIGSKTLERIIEQHNLGNELKAYKSTYKPSETYKVDKDINLWQGDCIELMEHIPDKSVDMVLCDLPYGTTACSWDTIIPFEPLWDNYKRIIKDNGAIVLFGQTPFDKVLGSSNIELLRYEWVWEKTQATGHLNANKAPMKAHENILVFYKELPTYNKQKTKGHKPMNSYTKYLDVQNKTQIYGKVDKEISGGGSTDRFPRSVIKFKSDKQIEYFHPTQKPVKLLEYLIKTYTDEGMIVLDNTMGTGSTGVACKNTNRKFIGIELDEEYFNTASKRILDK